MQLKSNKAVCRSRRVFFQLGIRRSGNHAIANWLGAMLAPSLLCNNNQLWPTDLIVDGVTLSLSKKVYQEQAQGFTEFGCIIYGMENANPCSIAHRQDVVRRSYDRCLEKKANEAVTVLLLRDPFNSFASILKHETQGARSYSLYDDGRFACLWLTQARAYATAEDLGYVAVDYNQWVTCVEYRRHLASILGCEFVDAGIDHVPSFGHGSSFFDGYTMSDDQRQQLNQRWKWLLEDDSRAYELWANTRNDLFWLAARRLYPELALEVEYELNRLWELNQSWEKRYARGFTDSV